MRQYCWLQQFASLVTASLGARVEQDARCPCDARFVGEWHGWFGQCVRARYDCASLTACAADAREVEQRHLAVGEGTGPLRRGQRG